MSATCSINARNDVGYKGGLQPAPFRLLTLTELLCHLLDLQITAAVSGDRAADRGHVQQNCLISFKI